MKFKFLLVMIMCLMLTSCGESVQNNVSEATSGDSSTSKEAPYVVTFAATTTEGESITSDIFAGSKLTMINVWATYCNPCLAEMPDLGELASAYPSEDFRILGIISDVTDTTETEDISYAKELIEQTGAAYPHLLLSESLYVNMVGAVEAVPTTFFVNQKGEALGYVVGSRSKEAWEEIINELLAEEK